MTLVMLFGLMAAGLPQAQAVTQDDINNLKSQAASLKFPQKADIQKKLDSRPDPQTLPSTRSSCWSRRSMSSAVRSPCLNRLLQSTAR